MPGRLPNYSVRKAIIRKVATTYVECEFTDRRGEAIVKCPTPHPMAGQSGGGMFFCPEVGTSVLIARGPMETPYIVQSIPERELYFSTEGIENTSVSTTPYPARMKPGEICIKGPTGSRVDFLRRGNISFSSNIGRSSSNLELSNIAQGMFTRVDNLYSFTEAGRSTEGVIKRDLSIEELVDRTNTFNFLDGEAYDEVLSTVGRSPLSEVALRSTTLINPRIRNPGLVEKRSVVYEYADSFNVRGLVEESDSTKKADATNTTADFQFITRDPTSRSQRRTDVLNLNLNNYNHLIEKVEGTLVDIYGNVVDINRNIIPVPDSSSIDTSGLNTTTSIKNIHDYLRRSVKMHYEINSRKNIPGTEPNKSEAVKNNANDFSRFSIDIDGEGLTKINIPASSETGNIPVLSRYTNSRDDNARNAGQFKDSKRKDIRNIPFSKGGPKLANTSYKPTVDGEGSITAGTAHHDLFNTASSIFSSGKHGNGEIMESEIDNAIGSDKANAGGRSLHMNLDGSAELSIGADSIDNKSLVLDLAGCMISHFGRDKQGRGLVHQSDGDVIIQIGDDEVPGRMEIHLTRPGGTPQKIIIDDSGITIAVQGNAVYSSTGSTTISADGQLMLHGEIIGLYGAHDSAVDGTRSPTGFERHVIRNGKVVI